MSAHPFSCQPLGVESPLGPDPLQPWILFDDPDRPGSASTEHQRRIGRLAASLARATGWSDGPIADLELAASLHDIGKLGVPVSILRKPRRLTAAEFAVVQSHTLIGGRLLASLPLPAAALASTIALYHHERWDGAGYPFGLAGEQIPLAARIVAVVDVYDALREDRVYRTSLPEAEVLERMRAGRGSHFDPRLLDAFLRLVSAPTPAASARDRFA